MSSDNSIEQYNRLTSKQRYQLLVEQARQTQQLWTLSDEQGCLIVETGEEKVLLLWSEATLAEHWASKDHPNFQPLAIPLGDFIEKWAPGMSQDGFDIAVAPSFVGEGTIVSPLDLADELTSGKIK